MRKTCTVVHYKTAFIKGQQLTKRFGRLNVKTDLFQIETYKTEINNEYQTNNLFQSKMIPL